jgi:hypothetical protein
MCLRSQFIILVAPVKYTGYKLREILPKTAAKIKWAPGNNSQKDIRGKRGSLDFGGTFEAKFAAKHCLINFPSLRGNGNSKSQFQNIFIEIYLSLYRRPSFLIS